MEIYKENQSLLERIQNSSSTYNFRKFRKEDIKRWKKRKLDREYIKRVFKASPGFSQSKIYSLVLNHKRIFFRKQFSKES